MEENLDPWKHRSKSMTCASCMWFVMKILKSNEASVIGRCRRHSPTMNGYPAVLINDWCGDHKIDENKIP